MCNNEIYIVCPTMLVASDLYSRTLDVFGDIFVGKTYKLSNMLQIHFKNARSFYFITGPSYNDVVTGGRKLAEVSSSSYEQWLKEFELQQRTNKYLGRKR